MYYISRNIGIILYFHMSINNKIGMIKEFFHLLLNSLVRSRCLTVSTNQADPIRFNFRISWILMERHWFLSRPFSFFFSKKFFLPHSYLNRSQINGYQGFFKILMITLISSKKLGNTVPAHEVLDQHLCTGLYLIDVRN